MTAEEFSTIWDDPSDTVEARTSGSTGSPKVIRLYKHDMRLSAEATNRFFGLGAGARFVCPMSFDFVGARMMLVRARMASGTLEALTPSNSFTFNGTADLVAIVPSQVEALIAAPGNAVNVIIGGAPLDARRRRLLAAAGINAFTTYGMTETASHVALSHVSSDIYTALPGVIFSVDSRNCLVIDMPGRIVDHIVTNDIVELETPGRFRWLGRFDNIINSGGLKINPEDVERVAAKVLTDLGIDFSDILLSPVPSAKWGEEAVLFVKTDTALAGSIADDIIGRIKAIVPDPRKAPRRLSTVAEFPRTSSGKIDRRNFRPF